MKQQLICINCPRGCHLEVETTDGGEISVSGNNCPRGVSYATQEMTAPMRVVTAVIATVFAEKPYLPIRTDKPFPKGRIPELLNALYKLKIEKRVKRGDVIWENAMETGVNVIASATL